MATILIVDDEEMDRVMERSMLDGLGHTFLFASDGDIAVSVYQKEEVDLVITDLAMPELNGLRLIREIMEINPDARIIAVSGVSADQLDLAENMGAVVPSITANLLKRVFEFFYRCGKEKNRATEKGNLRFHLKNCAPGSVNIYVHLVGVERISVADKAAHTDCPELRGADVRSVG